MRNRSEENIEGYPYSWNEKDMLINIDFKGRFGLHANRSKNEGKKLFKYPKSQIAGRYCIQYN